MAQPGEIYSNAEAHRIVQFSGMVYGKNSSPTDMDGCLEFDDKVFIYFDCKQVGKEIDTGQELCFTRMVNRLRRSGAHSIFIIADHRERPGFDVIAAKCEVRTYYENRKWQKPVAISTLKNFIDEYLKRIGMGHWIVIQPEKPPVPIVPAVRNWTPNLFMK